MKIIIVYSTIFCLFLLSVVAPSKSLALVQVHSDLYADQVTINRDGIVNLVNPRIARGGQFYRVAPSDMPSAWGEKGVKAVTLLANEWVLFNICYRAGGTYVPDSFQVGVVEIGWSESQQKLASFDSRGFYTTPNPYIRCVKSSPHSCTDYAEVIKTISCQRPSN